MKAILPRDISESLLQSALKVMQKLINLSGCFGDSKICGMYVKVICKYCLPVQFVAIDYKHVQINKMVLNTANCLGSRISLIQICWIHLHGLSFGKLWKTIRLITISIFYLRKLTNTSMKDRMMSRFYTRVLILYLLRVLLMRMIF